MEPLTSTVQREGVDLCYSLYPSTSKETPVVLIMGLSGSKENWLNLPKELSKHRPVLTFDNRGIGKSGIPEGPYTTEIMAADCYFLTQHVGWKQFHVFGISMGGMIAQTFTLQYSNSVKKLILGCTRSSVTIDNEDNSSVVDLIPPRKKTYKRRN